MLDLGLYYAEARMVQREFFTLAKDAETELKQIEAGIAVKAADYAAEISPFWTGALSTSHTAEDVGDMHHVFLDDSVINPITGDHPSVYGIEQHAMGGEKAFYTRTVEEIGPQLLEEGAEDYLSKLEAII